MLRAFLRRAVGMEVFCMCGIVGYVGKRNAQDVLLDGLEKLEYRGYDSAGVALALEGGIRVVKSKGRLAELRKRLAVEALARSGCGIGHTRWATHGEPSDVNSHPHSTPRVSIVHNGIIENYGVPKERLMAKGYTFESETDTEVLVKLIDSCYEGEPLKALRAALAMVRGSYALAVLFRDFPDTLFAVKRESPLIVGWGEEENFIASDIPALLKYTRRYSVLEEGDMAVVNADGIRFYNEFAEPVEREVLTANWDQEACHKGAHGHADHPVLEGTGKELGSAQRHKGHQVVQQDFTQEIQEGRGRGCPEAQQHLQAAVDKAGEQAPLHAVAEGDQNKGQHAQQGNAAAVGQGEELDVAQHGANGDHQGALHKNAGLGIGF